MFKKFSDEELTERYDLTNRSIDKRIRCSLCDALITDAEQKFYVNGAHRHSCTNPAHQTFNIGCFKEAPGCMHVGTPTKDHTWFLGYAWRIAICNSCRNHLGWIFLGAHDQFHGLILDTLVED